MSSPVQDASHPQSSHEKTEDRPQEAYPRARWRLMDTCLADGPTNMAIDEAIMMAVSAGLAPPTLRFFGWSPPCVSIGYSQSLAGEVDLALCRKEGVNWVRRPTGGRALLHTDELTYSLTLPLADPRAQGGVVESYRRLSRGLVAGLQLLGLAAAQAEYQGKKEVEQSAACFDVPSHYEVTVNGRKLVGSAQTRRQGVLLQHGSLPLEGDVTRLVRYLSLSGEQERQRLRDKLAQRATTLEHVLGRSVSYDDAVQAMQAGFTGALNLELVAGGLTESERTWVQELKARKYGHPDWNNLR